MRPIFANIFFLKRTRHILRVIADFLRPRCIGRDARNCRRKIRYITYRGKYDITMCKSDCVRSDLSLAVSMKQLETVTNTHSVHSS